MTEATGFEAKTIHRLLEVDPKGGGFKRSTDNPLRVRPARRGRDLDGRCRGPLKPLLKAVPDNAALLIVGDIDQLPSVGPGQVLADIIAFWCRAGRAPDRDIPAGGAEPHHHRRP